MSGYLLGVDAGNSKTVAMVVDPDGRTHGRGRAGNGDIYGADSPDLAAAAVITAVRSALQSAGIGLADVQHAAFRLAGVDWDEDADYWEQAIRERLAGLSSFTVRNDGYALLRCGRDDGVGVAITAGSGPALAARGPDGREWCASWWIQQELAGIGLGDAAFRAVIDAETTMAEPTALTAALLSCFGYDSVEELLHAFTRRDRPRPHTDLRVTARLVLRAAMDGDGPAMAIVQRQTAGFARFARAAAAKVGLDQLKGPVPVVIGGSVLTSELPAYRDGLIRELQHQLGEIRLAAIGAAPLIGAALDALDEAGLQIGADVRERLLAEAHPSDFFIT